MLRVARRGGGRGGVRVRASGERGAGGRAGSERGTIERAAHTSSPWLSVSGLCDPELAPPPTLTATGRMGVSWRPATGHRRSKTEQRTGSPPGARPRPDVARRDDTPGSLPAGGACPCGVCGLRPCACGAPRPGPGAGADGSVSCHWCASVHAGGRARRGAVAGGSGHSACAKPRMKNRQTPARCRKYDRFFSFRFHLSRTL